MITIRQIQIMEQGNRACLSAYIQLGKKAIEAWDKLSSSIDKNMKDRYQNTFVDKDYGFTMWYDVPIEYKNALCYERSDAFIVACLYFAMVVGEDILCETPVTEKLLYQLREYVIPALCDEKDGHRRIEIKAESAEECDKIGEFVGTGISRGIDSFSTIILHTQEEISQSFRLTHLTLFNTGSMNFDGYNKRVSLQKWREDTLREFSERIDIGKKVARDLDLEFINIDTNIPDLYQGAFLYSHTFRNCSAVLATQKMWKYYYYSSAGEGMINEVGLNKEHGKYDLFILPCISLEKLDFYSGGALLGRLQKTHLIADNPVVKRYLNVCLYETYNCGRCAKCIRTLMELDLFGKIDEYSDCFPDIEYYKTNKWKIMAKVLGAKPEDYFSYEIKEYMHSHGMEFDRRTKIYYYMLLPLRKLAKLIKKKVNTGSK